jgi:8-amino-7-oxononanoate synthase
MDREIDRKFGRDHPSISLHLLREKGNTSALIDDNKLFRQWFSRADSLKHLDELPLGILLEPTDDPTFLEHRSRRILNFGTNNYLGSTHLPEIRQAAKDAIDRFGVGSTASRLAGGTQQLHLRVETELSRLFFNRPGAILFNTGYMANFAVLTVLGQSGYFVFFDQECHASIYEGVQRSEAQHYRFRHNNAGHLKALLQKHGAPNGRNIVCVDGLYSMSGTIAPLKEIAKLRDEIPFLLLVDEAHSFGTIGPSGLGVSDLADCPESVDIITGTFSKSIGGIGGFAVFNDPTLELIRFAAPSYMYTAALPPPTLGGVLAALDRVIVRGEDLRAKLRDNCAPLSELLNFSNQSETAMPGPVFSLRLKTVPDTLRAWQYALNEDFYVNLVLPPASPRGKPMLRVGISAAHSVRQIGQLCDLLKTVMRNFPIDH